MARSEIGAGGFPDQQRSERIGDQAVNIAQSAVRILRHPRVKPYVDLPRMSEVAEEMMRDSLNALVRRDVELAQKVLAMDDRWIISRPDLS